MAIAPVIPYLTPLLNPSIPVDPTRRGASAYGNITGTGKQSSQDPSDSIGARQSIYSQGGGYRANLIAPDWQNYLTLIADSAYNPIDNLDDGSITSDLLADASVTTQKLVDDAVTALKLGTASVTAVKVAANAIDTLNLINSAVTEIKVATSAITNTKIADGSITTPKLTANVITSNEILAGAVTAVKINVALLSAISANLGTITAGSIDAVTITGGTITGSILKTATSGERVEIDSTNGIRIYDSGNVLIAQLKGTLTFANGVISGSALTNNTVTSSKVNVATRGWTQTSIFSVTDSDTVAWGAGTFTASDGTAYSISSGNTGNMAARTYVYLDTGVSTTVYQTTTVAASAVGDGKVLIASCKNNTSEAVFQVFGGIGGLNLDGSDLVVNSITGNEIAASTITASNLSVSTLSSISANLGTITAGSIDAVTITGGTITGSTFKTASGTGERVEIDSTNGVRIYNSSNTLVAQFKGSTLTMDGGTITGGTITGTTFKTASGTGARIEIDSTNGVRIYNSSNTLKAQFSQTGAIGPAGSSFIWSDTAQFTTALIGSIGSCSSITASGNFITTDAGTGAVFGGSASYDMDATGVVGSHTFKSQGHNALVVSDTSAVFKVSNTTRLTVNSSGITVVGAITGSLTGNVTGNVTGNLTGNVTGNLTGNVTGDITSSGTSSFAATTTSGNASIAGGLVLTTSQSTVNGNIGGDLTITEAFPGASFKLIIIRLRNFSLTASYTFNFPFVAAPLKLDPAGVVSALSTTAVTITDAGLTNGWVMLMGF